MKIKTNLFERSSHKFMSAGLERSIIYTAPQHVILREVPEFYVAEQKFFKALDPTQTHKAFVDSQSKSALDAARKKHGKISVTKVVQEFFASPQANIMRMMQNQKIDSSDGNNLSNYLHKIYRKMLRQEIPQKTMKKLS